MRFEWDVPVSVGCTLAQKVAEGRVPEGWPDKDRPCRRMDPKSNIDHYEAREPHLLEDGFEEDRFDGPESPGVSSGT